MLKNALALLVASVMLLSAPILAVTPEQDQFVLAQATFQSIKDDLSAGLKLFAEDDLTAPVISATLSQDLQDMDDVIVSDCFSKWYSLQYSALTIVTYVVIDLMRNGGVDKPEYTQAIGVASGLQALALAEFPNIDCSLTPIGRETRLKPLTVSVRI